MLCICIPSLAPLPRPTSVQHREPDVHSRGLVVLNRDDPSPEPDVFLDTGAYREGVVLGASGVTETVRHRDRDEV